MAIKKISGSKIFIGPRSPYKNKTALSDFSTVTDWTEIGGWLTAGDMGVEVEMITQLLINQGITEYSKGPMSFPASTQTFSPDKNDAGQIKFNLAASSCHPYKFRIDWGADCAIEEVVTISNGDPAVVSWESHPMSNGDPVTFTTTGALPTGLSAGTTYFVVAATEDSFSLSATPSGAAIATTGAGTGVHSISAMPSGETEYILGFAVKGTRSGGEANGTRQQTFIIQPIAESLIV